MAFHGAAHGRRAPTPIASAFLIAAHFRLIYMAGLYLHRFSMDWVRSAMLVFCHVRTERQFSRNLGRFTTKENFHMQAANLSFAVRLASADQDFRDACTVRAIAYGHHDPEMGPRFGDVEQLDVAEGTVVLLCRDQATGQCMGTARIQVSGFGPLTLESSLMLPPWVSSRLRAQISRLAVVPGASNVVKLLLMKASYQYCLATQVRWMVIGARSAALIRNYRSLGFQDVFEPGSWHVLASGGGLPHQILALDVAGARDAWQETKNRLLAFMTETEHADVQVFAANDEHAPARLAALAA